jgi:hypothetical protein
MDRVDEMTSPPIVGRTYLVPCVRAPRDAEFPPGYVPVFGARHRDYDLIGFPYDHWHHDRRFTTPRHFALGMRIAKERGAPALIFDQVLAVRTGADLPEPVWRPRKCWREMPAYPDQPPRWLPDLEDAYQGKRLRGACKVCPHRGLPLASLPASPDGTVTCPGHGLRWNVSTGRLVRRTAP